MAFQDSVAQSLTGNGSSAPDLQAQTGRPDDATMPSAVPPAAATGAPTTPAPPPTAPSRPMQPAAPVQTEENKTPGHLFKHLSHSFAGAILGSLAGPAPVDYSVDASGRTVATPRPDSTASRLRRLAEAALIGLASGSRVPPQANKGAAWASGIGAGAEAGVQRQQQQDLLKRQQAREDYEQQQRTIANRATVWMHNVQRYRDYLEAAKLEADMNPEYQLTQSWKDSIDQYNADNPGAPHDYKVVSPEAAQAFLLPTQQGQTTAHTADSHPMGNWVVVGALPPLPLKDNNGQPMFNEDGSVKTQGRVLLASADEKGKWAIPPAFIDSMQQYKDVLPGNLKNLKAGDPVDPRQFALINMAYMKAKAAVQGAWKTEKLASADGTERIVSYNQLTNETREGAWSGAASYNHDPKTNKWYKDGNEVPITQVPVKVQQEFAKIGESKASQFKSTQEGEKAQEETKQLREWDQGGPDGKGRIDAFGNPVGAPGMDRKEYLKRVDAYTKDYSKDLNQLDAARSQLSNIITNAEKTKKLPGADAVVGIFDAIGISSAPLKGRGFRINSQVVSEHVEGTRNAWQSMALKLSRLTPTGTGQIVSLEQLKDYERIMNQARLDAYVGAANDAVNRGIGIQFAPRGNGAPIDANTRRIFLRLAKNDPNLASAIAKQYGWLPPAGE